MLLKWLHFLYFVELYFIYKESYFIKGEILRKVSSKMKINKLNYIVNQSNGLVWNFVYYKNNGIIYRIMEHGEWSDYNYIVKNCRENFSVVMLSKEVICLLYQDYNGSLFIKSFDGMSWYKYPLIKPDKEPYKDFKAVIVEGQIYIIFSILDKATNTKKLFYQVLDSQYNLSVPKFLDDLEYDYSEPFSLYSTEDNKYIYVLYQKGSENISLGYKILNIPSCICSEFNLIDTSTLPFIDYSFVIKNNNLHGLYIKTNKDISSIEYIHGLNNNYTYNRLAEVSNIDACSISIINTIINCSWIKDNMIYSSFSIDEGESFSTPSYSEELNTSHITRCTYITDNTLQKELNLAQFYAKNNLSLYYPFFINLFLFSRNKNNSIVDCFNYYIDNILISYEAKIDSINEIIKTNTVLSKSNDQLINKLKHSMDEANNTIKEKDKKLDYFKSLLNDNSLLINVKNKELEKLNISLKYITNNVKSKDNELNELNVIISEVKAELQAKENEIEKLNSIIRTKDNLITSQKQELNNISDYIKAKEVSINSYEAKYNSIVKVFAKFQESKNLLNEAIQHLQKNLIEKDNKIKILEDERILLEKDLYCLNQRVEDNMKTILQKETELIALKEALKKFTSEA